MATASCVHPACTWLTANPSGSATAACCSRFVASQGSVGRVRAVRLRDCRADLICNGKLQLHRLQNPEMSQLSPRTMGGPQPPTTDAAVSSLESVPCMARRSARDVPTTPREALRTPPPNGLPSLFFLPTLTFRYGFYSPYLAYVGPFGLSLLSHPQPAFSRPLPQFRICIDHADFLFHKVMQIAKSCAKRACCTLGHIIIPEELLSPPLATRLLSIENVCSTTPSVYVPQIVFATSHVSIS
jgi:hypothetical protein